MTVVAVPLIALIAVTSASLVLQHNERQERAVALTASALSNSAQQVLSDAVNAETGMRGYAATVDPLFLQPYNLTLTRIAADEAALRAAAVAEGDSGAARAAVATTAEVMAELARLRPAIAAGVPAAALLPARVQEKATMDALRSQVAGLTEGPVASNLARRADISRLESIISWVSIAGLALGVLAGVIGVALFTSGISRRLARAAANAERLGERQPLERVPVPAARDELGQLARSLVHTDELLGRRTTELITARDEAVTATQAKNAFLSSTSHELRTPLNAVLGFAQLLQMSGLGQEDQDGGRAHPGRRAPPAHADQRADRHRQDRVRWLEPVGRAGRRAARRPGNLPAHGSRSPPTARSRSARPARHPALAVQADHQRLRQILVNLLSNAVKYNRAGGTVTVTCHADGPGQASLTVADTGPGIAAADLERVFVPFERLGAELTAVEGTGIGLPLARAFAEAMHGHLTGASVPGEGTSFHHHPAPGTRHHPASRPSRPSAPPGRRRRPRRRQHPRPVHRGQPGQHRGRHPVPAHQA